MQDQLFFGSTPTTVPGRLLFKLVVPGRLPSWNQILSMEQWARYKFKQDLADAFLSALKATADDSSMKTTSAKNTMSIYVDMLERYLAMKQAARKSRSAKKRLELRNQNGSKSKSTSYGKPPF